MYLSRTRHPEDTQFHHVVPRQVYTGTLSRLTEEQREKTIEVRNFLNELGYTKQKTDNLGLYLPKYESSYDTNRSTHRGYSSNHKQYNEDFVDEMYELVDLVRSEGYTKEQSRELIDQTLAEMRQDIRTGDIDVGPTDYTPSEGVELDRSLIFGLNVGSKLRFAFMSTYIGTARQKNLAHEIDGLIRNRETPWLSLMNIKNRYMVVESSCHDTLIADAFLRLDYAMKMLCSCAQLMLPYDLITEEKVQKQCQLLEAVKAHEISIDTAIQSLKDIGFETVDFDDELYKKCMDDREAYIKARETKEEELIRKNGARTMDGLTVRAKLVGLEQDLNGTLRPQVFTYINAFQQFSSGAQMGETSFDTQYLKSMLEYLQAQKDLKQAFIIVKRVATLFPLIEHLIRQHKKLTFSSEHLAEYYPPQTPRRVPVAIRYGDLIDNPNQKIISVYGGVQLTHERVDVIQVAYLPKHLKRTLKFQIKNQELEERQMYESAISNLKEPRQDTLSCIDPSLIKAVESEWARDPSEISFGHEMLRLEDKTPQPVKPTPVATPKEVTVLIPEPVKKEPEKQKKNSCCVVM